LLLAGLTQVQYVWLAVVELSLGISVNNVVVLYSVRVMLQARQRVGAGAEFSVRRFVRSSNAYQTMSRSEEPPRQTGYQQ
jgi:hypothetical protein